MNSLFVSDAHIRTVVYRTDSLYRATFKVVIATAFLLFLAVGVYAYLMFIEQGLLRNHQKIQTETTIIAKEAEKVAPLLKRIADVARWKPVIEQRLRVTDVLSKIESATNLNTCIKTIELQNELPNACSFDAHTVLIDGWSRTSSPDSFIQNLNSGLPGYSVKMDTPPKEAEATADVKPFRVILSKSLR